MRKQKLSVIIFFYKYQVGRFGNPGKMHIPTVFFDIDQIYLLWF